MQTTVLSAEVSAVGWSVDFLAHPFVRVVECLSRFREGLGQAISTSATTSFPQCLELLEPLEAPWTKELLVDCGEWTAYFNNSVNGGDATAAAPALRSSMGGRLVQAGHTPLYGPRHASTHLWISGPDGEPPLMYERSIQVTCNDGRWEWDESGNPMSFEHPDQYGAKLKRNRLNWALLIEYLAAFDIRPDDPEFWGSGVVVTQHMDWHTRKESFAEATEGVKLRP